MRQASGRTATFTGPLFTAMRGRSTSGPSATVPSASATAGNSIASPMKPATNSLCGVSYRARRALLRNQALVHHNDLVAHGHGLSLVVCDVSHRERQALLQGTDFLTHLTAQAGVEVGQGLVEQQHLGVQHQRPGPGPAPP